ncbi:lectin-like domain-containing protein [Fructilactobacillus fructivorans]|uniref:lectin-like domain-containing protein n=1 Tax=Fructilactobacillus fructivorans TaxID=1614 RepID=UPI00071246B4|nr:hypothetical protein [Fructilactobacillus fructivorans]KRN42374.1 secreted protein [Fructilactobacillus fructivorans]
MKIKKEVLYKLLVGVVCTALFMICGMMMNASADPNNPYDIPEPPESGPAMDKFMFAGVEPNEDIQKKYPNVQVVTDNNGEDHSAQTMWWRNQVDLQKPFTIKFYIYMKNPKNTKKLADGLTFTLQNDKPDAIGSSGESLGSYGNVRQASEEIHHGKDPTKAYLGTQFIHNALSFEFDPYYNGDFSDHKLPKEIPHTAFIYPNEYTGPFDSRRWEDHIGINHHDYSETPSLTSRQGTWIPVTYKWMPNSWTPNGNTKSDHATATVTYNDPKSGHPVSGVDQHTTTENVNLDQFKGDYAWWGFTGATGALNMISAIANTEIPQIPGVKKLACDLSALQRDGKYKNIDPYDGDQNAANDMIKQIDPNDFKDRVTNAKVGDVILYKVDTYNYKDNGLGNSWDNVKVTDNIANLGMRGLDDNDQIVAEYPNGIEPIDDDGKPDSVGFRTIITDPNPNTKQNTVTAKGSNFTTPDDGVVKSSQATVEMSSNPYDNVKPRVSLQNQMSNDGGNTWTNNLTDVKNNSEVQYKISLHNMIEGTEFKDGSYSFVVPSIKNINNINVNGSPISKSDYMVSDTKDYQISGKNSNTDFKNAKKITIHNLPDMNGRMVTDITADLQLGDNNPDNMSSIPELIGTDRNQDDLKFKGKKETYNFWNGSVVLNQPQDLDYGVQNDYFFKDQYLQPRTMGKNKAPIDMSKGYEVASLTDDRRVKSPYSVWLSQENTPENNHEIGRPNSPFSLAYFDLKSNQPTILQPGTGNTQVYNYPGKKEEGKITNPIKWGLHQGLDLRMNYAGSATGKTGNYDATLNWNIKYGSKADGTP